MWRRLSETEILCEVMAEVKPSTSRGEDAAETVGEASCSGADGSTSPESIPPSIVTKSPSFFKRICIRIQILTACSGLWGVKGGGLSGPRTSGLASGAQPTQEDSESEVSSRIAASKSTWSEVPGRDIHHSVSVPRSSQLSVWEELKASAPRFFKDLNDILVLGRLIAEGGQAQIFEAKVRGQEEYDYVLKVFKLDAGFSLADLKRHWPRSMVEGIPMNRGQCKRKDSGESRSMQERSSRFIFEDAISNIHGQRCVIQFATLLEDGRFAFLMRRYWGDLRTLIDQKVKDNSHPLEIDSMSKNRRGQPPFSFYDSIQVMSQIAKGMQGLHVEGVLHRDLKVANVLIRNPKDGIIFCKVADYECAMFVQGTGFWRAPEVLKELLKSEEDRNGDICTKKVDVYSFGMTCYEILTGQIPFDGYTKSKWGDVIRGERPSLPDYVFPKLRELVEACWHAQRDQRPSFLVILEKLISLRKDYKAWN